MFPLRDSLPRHGVPWVVWGLMLINTLAFVWLIDLPPRAQQWVLYHLALVPARYVDPSWALAHGLDPNNPLPFLSNMFLHGGWFHLIGNLWTLWIFGPAVEDRMGSARFLIFYLLCGLFASYMHFYFNATSVVPALGASGAIAGVIGAYALLFPHARIIILVPVLFIPFFFEIPAILYAGIWYLLQLLQGTTSLFAPRIGGGVAWWAHVGGFVAGMLLVRPFTFGRQRRWYPDEGVYGFLPDGRRARTTTRK